MKKLLINLVRVRTCPGKIFKIMKLSFVFLSAVLLQLSAEGFNQEIKLSMQMEDVSVKTVFKEIESMTNYRFVFNDEIIMHLKQVSIDAQDKEIGAILNEILEGSGIEYRVLEDKLIVLAPGSHLIKQGTKVTGTVTDAEGTPLPGVNIVEVGTTNGAVTDLDGNYTITVSSEDAVLSFSFVGYLTEVIEVGGQTSIDVTLVEDILALDEVVVIGYGTMRKSDLTGSVTRANIETFEEAPNVTIAQSLQGAVPGLNVGQVDEAGENPDISIRGRSTLSGATGVLIVLDGIIFSGNLSDLNPADIESIDILKDASSKAIYGAQAANGVIIVTTKEGKVSEKPIFRYSGSYTFQSIIPTLHKHDRQDQIQKAIDRDWQNFYLPPDYTQLDPEMDPLTDFSGGTPEVYRGFENGTEFDWWNAGIQDGFINTHNLSASGSQKSFTYYLSVGYTDQQNIVLNDDFTRKTARINVSNQIFDWFEIGINSFGSFSDYSGASPNLYTIFSQPPVVTPYDEDGNLYLNPNGQNMGNPLTPTFADDFDKRNHLNANFFADIDIPFVKGLNYRLNYGNNYSWDRHYYSNLYKGLTKAGEAFKINQNMYDWTIDNILTYNRMFDEMHNLNVTLLAGQREVNFENTRAEATDFSTIKLGYNDLSIGTIQTTHSGAWDESYLYQMGRVNYRHDNRYLITATLRRDGFSGFAKNQKFAYFPSVALGWVLSNEAFMGESTTINQLKLRASWGSNGNLVNRYASLARLQYYSAYVSGDGGSTILGQQVASMANPNLSWESTVGFNFGVDFALFDSRLFGNVDYYMTTTNDLIYNLVIPQITGFNTITSNVGEIANRGIEAQLGGMIVKSSQFSWDMQVNFSSNKNEIKSLIGLDADGDGQEDDLTASGLFIGESINAIYTYEEDGMIQVGDENIPEGFLVGSYRIVDNNPDGFFDPEDRVIIGREEPAYRFGILNTLQYGNFELKFFINSIQGGKDGYLGDNMPSAGQNHVVQGTFKEHDYWSPVNPDAKWRNLSQGSAVEYIHYDDRSFIRLQDASLAYRFDNALIRQLGLSSAKVYVSGKNLVTITDWIGWDPETGSGISVGGRPVLRGYTFGVDLSF